MRVLRRHLQSYLPRVQQTMSTVVPLTLQVSFAFEEPRKQAAKIKSHTFKVALVASDCLLLGEQHTVTQ